MTFFGTIINSVYRFYAALKELYLTRKKYLFQLNIKQYFKVHRSTDVLCIDLLMSRRMEPILTAGLHCVIQLMVLINAMNQTLDIDNVSLQCQMIYDDNRNKG